jgi:hypothetical protein
MNRDQHFIPAIIATAVAAMGLGGLLLVNHGPWNKPKVKNETMIQYGTTAASAAAAGAAVTPTAAKIGAGAGCARPEAGPACNPRAKELGSAAEADQSAKALRCSFIFHVPSPLCLAWRWDRFVEKPRHVRTMLVFQIGTPTQADLTFSSRSTQRLYGVRPRKP